MSTPALNSMIIIAGISRAFTEIVVLFNLSEYDRHAKDLCPYVYISAKSDPKDMGIWCANVLYECEIWCIIFKKQHRLKECDKKLLRMTFRDTKKEVTGKWE
jgi:hypothetical protein